MVMVPVTRFEDTEPSRVRGPGNTTAHARLARDVLGLPKRLGVRVMRIPSRSAGESA